LPDDTDRHTHGGRTAGAGHRCHGPQCPGHRSNNQAGARMNSNAILPLNRRQFLAVSAAAGGGLLLGFSSGSAAQAGVNAGLAFNPFIRIAHDNVVTLIIHKPENGQGAVTALCMMIAEELECDWDALRWEFAPVARE